MVLLGIESSCDDTSAAVSRGVEVLSNVTASQAEHDAFGGIVPELASRAHDRKIMATVDLALRKAGVALDEVDAIAVTQGPGLIGSLLVGLTFAKGLSVAHGLPLIGVDHIDAHMYAGFIGRELESGDTPFLALVVSGGHTRLVLVEEPLRHRLLGKTRDDAAGEAFDKTGKLMGLGYPAGPIIDRLSQSGDPSRYVFPQALRDEGYDFSFSGLKTSVRYRLEGMTTAQIEQERPHLSAGISEAVTEVLVHKMLRAVRETGVRKVVLAGGVSANSMLRRKAAEMALEEGVDLVLPAMEHCTDNAAMICRLGWIHARRGTFSDLGMNPYARHAQ
jgi:N6-L-threonylcarbamoyladenine synthase